MSYLGESFASGGSHSCLGKNVRGVIHAQASVTGSHSRLGTSDRESRTTGVIRAYDNGNTYLGIIVCKDPETDMWVTVFEDGEEDQTADPATDSDYTFLD